MVFSIVLTLVGSGLIAGCIYVLTLRLPPAADLSESTALYYSDGTTLLARIGTEDRTVLPGDVIVDVVKQAAVAATDPGFFDSGSSTIARSVVRRMAQLEGSDYLTRLRTSVLAWRLEESSSKEEILARYLNGVAFGRGTFGVEAAARAYFGKTADATANAGKQVTTAEAILLASLAELPGAPPSEQGWARVRDSMVELGYLPADQAQALAFPQPIPYEPTSLSGPTGHIVNHALSELVRAEALPDKTWTAISNGGYEIVTTVHPTAQALLEKAADETVAGSVMYGQPENLQAAAAAVEPGTGRVLAYFGGHSGTGADFAGWYIDKDGDAAGYGAHPPGETFQVYVLVAALKAGISVRSRWKASSPMEFPPDRVGEAAVRNEGICPTGSTCTLADATVASLNTAYYALTEKVGAASVVEAASSSGIADMWAEGPVRVGLTPGAAAEVVPSRFGNGVGLGQYPVTVLDQAGAMAAFAATARPAPAHFVRQVRRSGEVVYNEALPKLTEPGLLSPAQAADLTWALSRVGAGKLTGRASASKTGSWGIGNLPTQTTHAWIVGYTANLALAVWVGNKAEEKPLKDRNGATVTGAGLPATIYRTFMLAAHSELQLRVVAFPKPAYTGDEDAGNA